MSFNNQGNFGVQGQNFTVTYQPLPANGEHNPYAQFDESDDEGPMDVDQQGRYNPPPAPRAHRAPLRLHAGLGVLQPRNLLTEINQAEADEAAAAAAAAVFAQHQQIPQAFHGNQPFNPLHQAEIVAAPVPESIEGINQLMSQMQLGNMSLEDLQAIQAMEQLSLFQPPSNQ